MMKGATTLFTNRTSGCYSCMYMEFVDLVTDGREQRRCYVVAGVL